MPTFYLTKRVTRPTAALEHMGVRLDLSMDLEEAAEEEEAPSSSSQLVQRSSSSMVVLPEVPGLSSSSMAPVSDYDALFLYKQEGGQEHFLDICSPADLERWPMGVPDSATGLYRRNYVSLTFRSETVMDDAYSALWERIEALAEALSALSRLRLPETAEYDFSPDGAVERSSSSNVGVRKFTLTRDALVPYPADVPTGYRLHVTCTAEGADPKIFLWRDDLPDRGEVVRKRPIAVCSPGDLVDYPDDEPATDQFPAHYRLAEWDLLSARLALLEETWTGIKTDTSQLARALAVHLGPATDVETPSVDYDA